MLPGLQMTRVAKVRFRDYSSSVAEALDAVDAAEHLLHRS